MTSMSLTVKDAVSILRTTSSDWAHTGKSHGTEEQQTQTLTRGAAKSLRPLTGWSCMPATMFPTRHESATLTLRSTSTCRTQVTQAQETTCSSIMATASTARSATCSTDQCESRQEIT